MRSKFSGPFGRVMTFAACCAFAVVAQADTITFENGTNEGADVSTQDFVLTGTTATITDFTFGEKGGSPRVGFYVGTEGPDDTVASIYGGDSGAGVSVGDFGDWFITDLIGEASTTVNFDEFDPGDIDIEFSTVVRGLSFWALDINGGGNETLTATAYASDDSEIASVVWVMDLDNSGDGIISNDGEAKLIDFGDATNIKRLNIAVENTATGNDATGWGIDNLSATAVPTPSSLAALASLSVMGLVGIGLRRRRNRRAA